MFWVDEGVCLFCVDNLYIKLLLFWEWMIGEVCVCYLDMVFLLEVFMWFKVMYWLVKVGFLQLYMYFMWWYIKQEFIDYLIELMCMLVCEYFCLYFFVNMLDINLVFLQLLGWLGFLICVVLVVMLFGLWGVYNGFELCEGVVVFGKEEYFDFEKYQLCVWDYNCFGNIVKEIVLFNCICWVNLVLYLYLGVMFQLVLGEQILFFSKLMLFVLLVQLGVILVELVNVLLLDCFGDNMVFVVINFDLYYVYEFDIELLLW